MIEHYYLFRHGPTEVTNKQAELGIPVQYNETNLTAQILPEGVATIEQLGKYLLSQGVEGYLSSPSLRCKQTCVIITLITGKEFEFDERLAEDEKQTLEERERKLVGFLKDLGRLDYKKVAICTHGTNISILINLLTNSKKIENPLAQFPKPGMVTVIAQGNTKIAELDFN